MKKSKILFVLNPNAGKTPYDWKNKIKAFFVGKNFEISIIRLLKKEFLEEFLNIEAGRLKPDILVAVGGDGTVKLVAECAFKKQLILGIIPTGSANGLARELGIDLNPTVALDNLLLNKTKRIHLININNNICAHLSDIGLNAYAMKKFKFGKIRGFLGYFLDFLKVLRLNPKMDIEMKINGEIIKIIAEMVVIANGTCYGNGAVINPLGNLRDNLFEIIVIKEISLQEVFKMIFSHAVFDINKTEIYQTDHFSMHSEEKVHFQIDGEYMGKVNQINAELLPSAIEVLVP
ncbi:diacylglycerol kinase family lipid kinase [Lacihabitans sp. LS3-19]|uniref:diacylglycerol/lipid kinase family protein n=1 Tax=Lacihabitans sp. LS3-19 TaxID=2487335 RepID=UPI0020CF29AD|nr:diacylglycerol kinase family protein [Lacihabitans sp. LS3-19]MCP9767043.1 diacylglycerol kinase family lipid kinase [Lacihabitans sp. LS3-19]